jgi:hypothetical protein
MGKGGLTAPAVRIPVPKLDRSVSVCNMPQCACLRQHQSEMGSFMCAVVLITWVLVSVFHRCQCFTGVSVLLLKALEGICRGNLSQAMTHMLRSHPVTTEQAVLLHKTFLVGLLQLSGVGHLQVPLQILQVPYGFARCASPRKVAARSLCHFLAQTHVPLRSPWSRCSSHVVPKGHP